MSFFPKKNNQTDNYIMDDTRRTNLLHWTAIMLVFVAVIFIMVINFCVISRNKAVYGMRDDLIARSETYAAQISHEFEMTLNAANVVAGIMSDEECTSDDIAWYAQELEKLLDNIYMVVIADNKGDGYMHDGRTVDISETDYYALFHKAYYYVTQNDGVTNSPAYVLAVPYYHNNNINAGNIYLFMSEENVADMIPTGAYDLAGSFAICDNKGNVLVTAGAKTQFLDNNDLIGSLGGAVFANEDDDVHRVVNRFGNMGAFTFTAEYKGETKYFVSVPLGISNWQYVTLLNQEYVDRLMALDWKNARAMTIELAIATVLFICFVITIAVLNRKHYNERNKELANKADTDLLTGLNNKMATERKIQEYIEQNPDKQCLFFLFDIDNFKKINDTLGHAFGDEVLRTLGKQLSNEFRVTDIIGRTGGDEFILFLKDINSEELLEKEATRFANFFRSFTAGEYVKYSATSSIGATVFPRDAKDYQGLYTTADSALYEAKRQGKNRMVFYNKDLEQVNPDKKRETPIDSDRR